MREPPVKCVLLADRHHGMIEGIRSLLEAVFEAVIMVADPDSLLEGAHRMQPTLAVMELSLARQDGLQLLRRLRARCPNLKIIVLSMHDEPSVARSVLEAGARGYVLKSSLATDLLSAVEVVLAGGTYTSPAIHFETNGTTKTDP